MDRKIHIVSLDVPYPPDYGGMVDIFYTIKYLYECGIKVTLHCFEYGRGKQYALEKYCEQVFYYPRKKTFSFSVPYIVISRKNELLFQRISDAKCPVLLEGIHCSYVVFRNILTRNVWIRVANVEHTYYGQLFLNSGNLFKRVYYYLEAQLLKKYESRIAPKSGFLALSNQDTMQFKALGADCRYLPLIIETSEIQSKAGVGNYCLYHGNLSVAENEKAVIFLVKEVFKDIQFPLIVAGKSPSVKLQRICSQHNIQLIANPEKQSMENLIREAHIHVLPSFNETGTKVKILNALRLGRYVLTNNKAIANADWAPLCVIADDAIQIRAELLILINKSFTIAEIENRKKIFQNEFDPVKNVNHLIEILFNSSSPKHGQ